MTQNKLILLPACQNLPPPDNLEQLPTLAQLSLDMRSLGRTTHTHTGLLLCFCSGPILMLPLKKIRKICLNNIKTVIKQEPK